MDGFTYKQPVAVLPKMKILIIINTYTYCSFTRTRKPVVSPLLFFSVFFFLPRARGGGCSRKKARFLQRKSRRDSSSFSRYTHTVEKFFPSKLDGHFVRAQRTRGARAGR